MLKKFLIAGLTGIFILNMGLVDCHGQFLQGQVGNQVRDFTLNNVNGKAYPFSETKGKVVMVVFWATWCPPCRLEIPILKELYRKYKDKGFEILGIAIDAGGAKDVKPFVEENGIEYPILIMEDETVAGVFGGIRGVPSIFIVDRTGKIAQQFVGFSSKKLMESSIKKLI